MQVAENILPDETMDLRVQDYFLTVQCGPLLDAAVKVLSEQPNNSDLVVRRAHVCEYSCSCRGPFRGEGVAIRNWRFGRRAMLSRRCGPVNQICTVNLITAVAGVDDSACEDLTQRLQLADVGGVWLIICA